MSLIKGNNMYDSDNIFAKILRKEIPCNKVHEDEYSLFFHDINPQAKIHVLGIPKTPCIDFFDFINKSDEPTVTSFYRSLSKVIEKLDLKKTGFRLVSNSGQDSGQEVPHYHVHILAGEKLGPLR